MEAESKSSPPLSHHGLSPPVLAPDRRGVAAEMPGECGAVRPPARTENAGKRFPPHAFLPAEVPSAALFGIRLLLHGPSVFLAVS